MMFHGFPWFFIIFHDLLVTCQFLISKTHRLSVLPPKYPGRLPETGGDARDALAGLFQMMTRIKDTPMKHGKWGKKGMSLEEQ